MRFFLRSAALITAIAIVAWIVSGWIRTEVYAWPARVDINGGVLNVSVSPYRDVRAGFGVVDITDQSFPFRRDYEFRWSRWRLHRRPRAFGIEIPAWAPLGLVGGCLILMWRRRHRSPDHCARCNYNLRGNVTGRCSECGAPVHVSRPPHRRVRQAAVIALLVLFSLWGSSGWLVSRANVGPIWVSWYSGACLLAWDGAWPKSELFCMNIQPSQKPGVFSWLPFDSSRVVVKEHAKHLSGLYDSSQVGPIYERTRYEVRLPGWLIPGVFLVALLVGWSLCPRACGMPSA